MASKRKGVSREFIDDSDDPEDTGVRLGGGGWEINDFLLSFRVRLKSVEQSSSRKQHLQVLLMN